MIRNGKSIDITGYTINPSSFESGIEIIVMEVCVENVASVRNAVNGGARRLELCSSLAVGGLTPSLGFVKITREIVPADCKLFIMIRPRAFDFNYTDDELRIMMEDIRTFKKSGADGFVFGCLTSSCEVDIEQCQKLLDEARPLPCTFHRAFDLVKNPMDSLVQLENLGFARILTSGQEGTALSGINTIKALIDYCKLKSFGISVMPGAGIDNENLGLILERSGAREFHGSAKSKTCHPELPLTCEGTVREMVKIGEKFGCCLDKQ